MTSQRQARELSAARPACLLNQRMVRESTAPLSMERLWQAEVRTEMVSREGSRRQEHQVFMLIMTAQMDMVSSDVPTV